MPDKGRNMKELNGCYISGDDKDYFWVALNPRNCEKVLIKNAGCEASAVELVMNYWCLNYALYNSTGVKMFFLGTSKEIDLKKIPKKYHKYFK